MRERKLERNFRIKFHEIICIAMRFTDSLTALSQGEAVKSRRKERRTLARKAVLVRRGGWLVEWVVGWLSGWFVVRGSEEKRGDWETRETLSRNDVHEHASLLHMRRVVLIG